MWSGQHAETCYLPNFNKIQKIFVFWEGQGKEKHNIVTHDDEEWFAVFSDSPPLKFEGSGSATTIFRPEWTFMEPLRTLCTAQSEIARRT